jgi:hypothetical protein
MSTTRRKFSKEFKSKVSAESQRKIKENQQITPSA